MTIKNAPKSVETPADKPQAKRRSVILDAGMPDRGSALPSGMPRSNDAFHLAMLRPTSWQPREGALIPDLVQIPHTDGVNGAHGTGNPGLALDKVRRKGGIVLPHSFPTVAFGERVDGYLTSTPARDGGEFYHDVWHKPEIVGENILWEVDEEGYFKFLLQVRDYVFAERGIQDIPDTYKKLALTGIRSELEQLEGRDDEPSKRRRDVLTRALKGAPKE